jgi:LmbE family N-acetylglucosaminyl deacetylase
MLCVISPHLDDAVLSCGDLLVASPDATVLTVFAGAPPGGAEAGPWDRLSTGESSAGAALGVRLAEDDRAMAVVGARSVRLPLLDSQYRSGPVPLAKLAVAVGAALGPIAPTTVLAPLGLRHEDHVAVSNACLAVARTSRADWHLYEEQPYGAAWPELVEPRLATIRAAGASLEPMPVARGRGAKAEAIAGYGSQVVALRRYVPHFDDGITGAERRWRLTYERPTSPVS